MKVKLLVLALAFVPATLSVPNKIQGLTDLQCMTANLYFESRSEGIKGMQMVAAVTYNRVKSVKYPKTVCAVVFQPWQFSWVKQVSYREFSQVVTGKTQSFNARDLQAYKQAYRIASMVPEKVARVVPKNVLWYHTVNVKPIWRTRLQVHEISGLHVFYSERK